ncbi:hypothetical protein CDN99_04445 [Roseateles aquatilis]|uniref:GntR C-terminal domain-containing protein n=1 Tax=Roseateles aquatilis TaxID=431061 RepID=A0A246JM42_9BURK|nr:GntR family transcriptional regulator [Roseateles aquatilis]OWQ93706.1 hypothetical protein CDN99_04445 [Roseateles aquatilis]
MTSSAELGKRLIESMMARRVPPGTHLSEQHLESLLGCRSPLVGVALARLETQGFLARGEDNGWRVVERSREEAWETLAARRLIECGLLRGARTLDRGALQALQTHLSRERAAVAGGELGESSFLSGNFHVLLAGCLGNGLLADTVRGLAARTALIAMQCQASTDAVRSCDAHAQIVAALEAGDFASADGVMDRYLCWTHDGLLGRQARRRPTTAV